MSAHSVARSPRARGPLVLVLSCAVLFALVSPLRGMWAARGDVNELRTEERSLDHRIAALQKERDLLTTDAEVERRAREDLGMVRPGEVAVLIPGSEVAPPRLPTVQIAEPPTASSGGLGRLLGRWWGAALHIARARV